jgi:glycerophosphoryl diester phosphodiesterase
MVRLEDFLRYFGGKSLSLALEFKMPNLEGPILRAVIDAGCLKRVTLTSFSLQDLSRARELNPEVALGFLTKDIHPEILDRLASARVGQICPELAHLSKVAVALAHKRGFSVRAWGVSDESAMHAALSYGVDGMTVNFPDKLAQALEQNAPGA